MDEIDVAALLLRVLLGGMLATHGANKVWGPGGLTGTAGWFDSLGLRPGLLHARLAAGNELLAGLLVVVGLVTPLACGAMIGLMLVAALTDHRNKGFFVFKGGWEYVGFVAVVALSLAVLGPGSASLDSALDLTVSGQVAAGLAAALGLSSAAGFWLVFLRPAWRDAQP